MNKEEILEKLSRPGRLMTRESMLEIQKNSENYKEELIQILEREADNPQDPASRMEYNDWLYAMYFLAELREHRAFRPTLKLFTRSGNFLNPLTGDFVLQNLGQILASVYNENIFDIKNLIENENLNEYCRGAGIEALVILLELKIISREEVYHYFDELFKNLERIPIFPWTMLSQSAIILFKKSFLKEVKQAFNNQLIDEVYLDLEEVEAYLSNPELAQLALSQKKHGIIIDAVAAMDWWADFKD